jgi:nicotinamidase-related amidase
MSGVSTNYVMQSAVREAHDRGYEVVILEDACSALSEEEHQWAIKGLSRMAQVTTSDTFTFASG